MLSCIDLYRLGKQCKFYFGNKNINLVSPSARHKAAIVKRYMYWPIFRIPLALLYGSRIGVLVKENYMLICYFVVVCSVFLYSILCWWLLHRSYLWLNSSPITRICFTDYLELAMLLFSFAVPVTILHGTVINTTFNI